MPDIQPDTPFASRLAVSFYVNCDDVQLCWRTLDDSGIDAPVENCVGFMIERQRKKGNTWLPSEILRNRVGFGVKKINKNDPKELTRPSNIWPFQRYDWTEHGANNNEFVRYRVSAVGKTATTIFDESELPVLLSSAWTDDITVSAQVDEDTEVYFNRGAMMSQYVARIAREKNWSAVAIKDHVKELKEPLRIFLSGELRIAMVKLLEEVAGNPFLSIYAALFELGDPELIAKLSVISVRASVILSDGANTKKAEGKPVEYYDENKASRKTLRDAGVQVFDRILGKDGLGHNKILIVVDNRTNEPKTVLTGSTNWTSSGLCTQLNNAIVFKKREIVQVYLDYWKKLKQAGNGFNTELMDFNSNKPHVTGNAAVWFTRTEKTPKKELPPDIKYIKSLIDQAQSSVLYVMFQPGSEPLRSILQKRADPNIYIRGVVSTVIKSNKEQFEILDESMGKTYKTDLIQPDGIAQDFSYWVEEVTRKGFIPKVGFAITHTKMIVIDAFGPNPVVITGSHNFSGGASQKNDENFVVISGNQKLAEHYAVACIATYGHYRYRGYVMDQLRVKKKVWDHLDIDPKWQNERLTNPRTLNHLNFWCLTPA